MTVWAVTRVMDEADIIRDTVSRMCEQVDGVIVADNNSTDGTLDILHDLKREYSHLVVQRDPEVGYYQSKAMTALALQAGELGAEFVIPFDADEVWLGGHGLRATLAELPSNALIAEATLCDHVPTAIDPEGSPVERIGWRRREVAPLRKVAVRPLHSLTIHQGNHGASFNGRPPLTITGKLNVRHFPYRSVEQMIRKARNGAAAYAATNLPEEVGAHWRGYGRLTDEQIGDVFREYFWSADPERDRKLVFDPV